MNEKYQSAHALGPYDRDGRPVCGLSQSVDRGPIIAPPEQMPTLDEYISRMNGMLSAIAEAEERIRYACDRLGCDHEPNQVGTVGVAEKKQSGDSALHRFRQLIYLAEGLSAALHYQATRLNQVV